MKKWILTAFAVLLCLMTVAAFAQEADGRQASIRLSFVDDGEGFEIAVEVNDPSIVAWTGRYDDSKDAEKNEDAVHDYIIDLTGLKPGNTLIRVYSTSLETEWTARLFTARVSEALNVTLEPVKMISSISVTRIGEIAYGSYRVVSEADGYHFSANEGQEKMVSQELVDELMEIIDRYEITRWDGFNGKPEDYILDGEQFWMEIEFTDGTGMKAAGDNVFPLNYGEAMESMWRIMDWMKAE